jgi:N-acetylglucosaminyl-diphospho-decaprenol L-rhamnosyltransferase
MEKTAERITLFVVHWNQPQECLNSVRAFRNQERDLEITIVDNASAPEAYDLIQKNFDSDVKIERLDENKGWGPALNIVLRKWLELGSNRYCLISAHDSEPSSECVRLLLQTMERDPHIGIACPQYSDATVASVSCLRGVQQRRAVALPRGTPQFVDVPHGTLMLLRRDCLAQIGLFDERYFAYGDEHELGARAVRRGWKIALVWGATVANRGTWTPSLWRSYLFTRNSLLFVHDYCGRVWAWLRAILILVNTARLSVLGPNDNFAFSVRGRWQGVRDFFAGRFGRPSIE